MPSLPEIEAEAFSGRDDAFSRLALPGVNGALQSQSGILDGGLVSFYWSRTQGVNTRFNGDQYNAGLGSGYIYIVNGGAGVYSGGRATGMSVRCIKI